MKKKKNAIKTGPFGSQIKSSEMINSEIKVYNQNNVLENDINKGNNYISKEKYKELKSFEVYPGDILITTRGTIGEAVLLPQNIEKGILHPCLMRIQPDNNKLNSKYLEIIINESKFFRTQLFLASNGTTIDVIYSENLKNVKVILPPLEEQNRLFNYIKEYNNEIDTLICKVEKQISNLKEYRQALITNAVTGKIDVRDLV